MTETQIFFTFSSQEERRAFGGSCFLELQCCRMPKGTSVRDILSNDDIRHWQNDSLYIPDENAFFDAYSGIFTGGVYHNLQTGVVDVCGFNYYDPELTKTIRRRLAEEKPLDYERLLDWLEQTETSNGFYLFGL